MRPHATIRLAPSRATPRRSHRRRRLLPPRWRTWRPGGTLREVPTADSTNRPVGASRRFHSRAARTSSPSPCTPTRRTPKTAKMPCIASSSTSSRRIPNPNPTERRRTRSTRSRLRARRAQAAPAPRPLPLGTVTVGETTTRASTRLGTTTRLEISFQRPWPRPRRPAAGGPSACRPWGGHLCPGSGRSRRRTRGRERPVTVRLLSSTIGETSLMPL